MTYWCGKCITNMVTHACEAYPLEACGLLIRHSDRTCSRRCRNDNPEEGTFALNPEDQLRIMREWEVAGTYHSHPLGLPVLSVGDQELLPPNQPDWIHVVIAMGQGEITVKAWLLNGTKVDIILG